MSAIPGLLVSVRSAAEAQIALAAGAAIIDVKEPSRGPLGRPDDRVIADVVRCVAGRAPVSAALGELIDTSTIDPPRGLTFCKLGLARCVNRDWRARLTQLLAGGFGPGNAPQLVIAGYADWRHAEAPPLADVWVFAHSRPGNVLLVDTYAKASRERKRPEDGNPDRRTLLDWLSAAEIIRLCQDCRSAQVRVALAGSLGAAEIARLHAARPDWFAVRGAACTGSHRESSISLELVRLLRTALDAVYV
jgi:uncharacterized protein (UPF0264 family)